jgi:hypothetical protein
MTQHPFHGRVVSIADIADMRDAVRIAAERSEVRDAAVAPIVWALYGRGMTYPTKCAETAAMLATSRMFLESTGADKSVECPMSATNSRYEHYHRQWRVARCGWF